jgi:hypothetical protein
VREPGHQNCVLCRSQSRECRFDSVPKIRAGRLPSRRTRPAAHDGARVDRDVLLTVENGIEQTVTVLEDNDEGRGQRSSDWRTAVQFVGLSGYQDPFVLQHCSFNTSNYYRQPDWMCLRVNGGGLIPMQFTVGPTPYTFNHSAVAKLTGRFESVYRSSSISIARPSHPITQLPTLTLRLYTIAQLFYKRTFTSSTLHTHSLTRLDSLTLAYKIVCSARQSACSQRLTVLKHRMYRWMSVTPSFIRRCRLIRDIHGSRRLKLHCYLSNGIQLVIVTGTPQTLLHVTYRKPER